MICVNSQDSAWCVASYGRKERFLGRCDLRTGRAWGEPLGRSPVKGGGVGRAGREG